MQEAIGGRGRRQRTPVRPATRGVLRWTMRTLRISYVSVTVHLLQLMTDREGMGWRRGIPAHPAP